MPRTSRAAHLVSCPASFWYFSASHGVCGKARPRREWWTHCQGAQGGHRPRGARPSGVRHARHCGVVVLANMPDIPCGPRLALTRMANSETPETCGTRHRARRRYSARKGVRRTVVGGVSRLEFRDLGMRCKPKANRHESTFLVVAALRFGAVELAHGLLHHQPPRPRFSMYCRSGMWFAICSLRERVRPPVRTEAAVMWWATRGALTRTSWRVHLPEPQTRTPAIRTT